MGAANYYEYVRGEYERKRDFLGAFLAEAGLAPIMPEGGFFIMADTAKYVFCSMLLLPSSFFA
jgi:aminotransferase